MSEDELARRQEALDERERELLQREEEFSRQTRSERSGQLDGAAHDSLYRPPPIVSEGPRRRLILLLVFLTGLGLVAWMALGPARPPTKDLDLETASFESPKAAGINLEVPKPLAPVPGEPFEPPPPSIRQEGHERLLQQEQEMQMARQRAPILIVQGQGPSTGHQATMSSAALPTSIELPDLDHLLPVDVPRYNGQANTSSEPIDPNTRFQRQVAATSSPTSVATRTIDRSFLVLQGKLIDAVAETAINSDLPGQIRALVSYDVYAESGRRVLLPRGTRLIGEYNTAIAKGQERLFIVWNRAIRPDGIDIALLSGGTDPLGRAGVAGDVDNHFWTIFGASALLSLIGAGAATAGVNPDQAQFNSAAIYRAGVAQSFNRSASTVLDRYLDIKPTIRIAHGEPLKVFVARDLDFSTALASLEPKDDVRLLR